MTPKEALEKVLSYVHLDEYDYVTSGVLDTQQIIEQALTERDIYYQALCDIESGKDVRMILERVLT